MISSSMFKLEMKHKMRWMPMYLVINTEIQWSNKQLYLVASPINIVHWNVCCVASVNIDLYGLGGRKQKSGAIGAILFFLVVRNTNLRNCLYGKRFYFTLLNMNASLYTFTFMKFIFPFKCGFRYWKGKARCQSHRRIL